MTSTVHGAEDAPDLVATRAEVLARIEAILADLARNAGQSEINRDLAPTSVDALIESGALRLFVPRRYGGYEAGYRTYVEATIKLASVCGSSAWLSFITNHSDWHTGQMSQSVQDTVWANGPQAKVGTPLTPSPGWSAKYVEGGINVSGEWPYASGSTFAKWSLIAFPKLDADGKPVDNILGLVSNDDIEIKDTWRVAGMAATGSNTIVVNDTFIPDEHTMLMSDMLANRFPTPHTREAMYQMDVGAVFHVATLVPCVGLAKAALDLTLARITTKPKPMTYTFYGDTTKAPATQFAMAKAAWLIGTALEQTRATADAIDKQAATARPFSGLERGTFAMRSAMGHHLCREAMDLLLDVYGAGAFALANPMQRIWRDFHIASRHGLSVPGLKQEIYGRALLGAEEQHMTPLV